MGQSFLVVCRGWGDEVRVSLAFPFVTTSKPGAGVWRQPIVTTVALLPISLNFECQRNIEAEGLRQVQLCMVLRKGVPD